MISNKLDTNITILERLETVVVRTVDNYLNKDNDEMLVSLKTMKDIELENNKIAMLLANEIAIKFGL